VDFLAQAYEVLGFAGRFAAWYIELLVEHLIHLLDRNAAAGLSLAMDECRILREVERNGDVPPEFLCIFRRPVPFLAFRVSILDQPTILAQAAELIECT
jgi:hypothetical protein